jgi:hypothetical protein
MCEDQNRNVVDKPIGAGQATGAYQRGDKLRVGELKTQLPPWQMLRQKAYVLRARADGMEQIARLMEGLNAAAEHLVRD